MQVGCMRCRPSWCWPQAELLLHVVHEHPCRPIVMYLLVVRVHHGVLPHGQVQDKARRQVRRQGTRARAGVLILSEFAGAAQSLGAGAILVNPWNITDMAAAIEDALTMSDQARAPAWQRAVPRALCVCEHRRDCVRS